MLYSPDSQKYINHIPHQKEFDAWTKRLDQSELDAIVDELTKKIDGDEIHTAGWLPGSDWTGTVFAPIYDKACKSDFESAAKCFGIFVWKIIMERQNDVWAFGKYEKEGVPIESMTYFKINKP